MYIYVRHGGGPRRPIGDVQTDVHIVPVDSDSPSRNLLKVQTVRCACPFKGDLERVKRGSKPIHSANLRLNPLISIV